VLYHKACPGLSNSMATEDQDPDGNAKKVKYVHFSKRGGFSFFLAFQELIGDGMKRKILQLCINKHSRC